MILFLMIAIPVFTIGILLTFWSQNGDADASHQKKQEKAESGEMVETDPSPDSEVEKVPEEEMAPAPGSEMISKEDKELSKQVAEKFARAYGTYDADTPLDFVEKAKPYMNEEFKYQWEKEPPRKALALVKSTVEKVEILPIDTADKNTIAWNVGITLSTINTLEDKGDDQKWLLMILEKENGEWKVKGVDVTNG